MKIYELTLKEAQETPQLSHDDIDAVMQRRAETELGNSRRAESGVIRGSIEDRLCQMGSVPKMGEYLQQQYDMKKGTKLKKTGSKEVDDMLRVMGFKI